MFTRVELPELKELEVEDIDGKRHYLTPYGKFPSITTVLGSFPNPALDKWRKRIGEDEANKISKIASSRGEKFHSLCEQYLLNNEIDYSQHNHDALYSFNSIKPILNRVDNIHFLEVPLFSNRLKVAGRCDLISEFDGTISIIDFKTSTKEKQESWIENYFIQTTFYALAYAELTGIKIKQVVIIIAVDDGMNQVFVKPIDNYLRLTINKINEFYKKYY